MSKKSIIKTMVLSIFFVFISLQTQAQYLLDPQTSDSNLNFSLPNRYFFHSATNHNQSLDNFFTNFADLRQAEGEYYYSHVTDKVYQNDSSTSCDEDFYGRIPRRTNALAILRYQRFQRGRFIENMTNEIASNLFNTPENIMDSILDKLNWHNEMETTLKSAEAYVVGSLAEDHMFEDESMLDFYQIIKFSNKLTNREFNRAKRTVMDLINQSHSNYELIAQGPGRFRFKENYTGSSEEGVDRDTHYFFTKTYLYIGSSKSIRILLKVKNNELPSIKSSSKEKSLGCHIAEGFFNFTYSFADALSHSTNDYLYNDLFRYFGGSFVGFNFKESDLFKTGSDSGYYFGHLNFVASIWANDVWQFTVTDQKYY